ncbi:MAG TPA: glycoside hydrolase family 3 C-terminal domain-containing protein [Mycobacterium sp.]|nr:glycoside hydrolase family 3 C-terminal domain-containing protein [Mycobacterium sp.]
MNSDFEAGATTPLTRRRLLAAGAGATAAALIGTRAWAASSTPAHFATQTGGTYDGMPLFDGNPDHIDAYLDLLMTYAGIEGVIRWANGVRGDFTIVSGAHAGKVVPGSSRFDEGLQGFSTDLPTPLAVGQTWNLQLVKQIGEVIGNEHLYRQNYLGSISAFNAMVSAPLQDIRINPLSGRLDEGFGEDPRHASDMVDAMSRGISGIDAPDNRSGFWTKAMIDTKHFTNYLAQWFRTTGNGDVSARAAMEYYSLPALNSIKSGAIGAMLTTYGRTNGIPNSLSPLISHAQALSRWGRDGGLYTTPDNGADRRLPTDNAFSNGFDLRYTPSLERASALMLIADQASIAVNTDGVALDAALLNELNAGTYGVTEAVVYKVARRQVLPLVRMGLFNERDPQGYPKSYPFLDKSAATKTPIDSTVAAHQQVAMQAAHEGLVLLKNDGNILPLKANAKVTVVGALSDARFKTTRAATTPTLPNAGLTPVKGIAAAFGSDIPTATDGNVVALKSIATGQYLTHDTATAPAVFANAASLASAAKFETFAWGQQAYGYRSESTGGWLQFAQNNVNVGGVAAFGTSATPIPYRIRLQHNPDNTVSFLLDTYTESFGGGFETRYYTNGRYLTVDPATGQLGATAVLGNAASARALSTDATKFSLETVRAAGSQAVSFKKTAARDYAIVVVGQPPRNSAGEGADRSELHLGDDQYQLIENVAKAYPKKTVVVVTTSCPLLLESVHKNKNVAAIVYAPYGGQYDNYALGQLLRGALAPTGRLTQTWYADMAALPKLDSYSLAEGPDAQLTIDGLDPRFTVDMTNGDPYETRLTYMYTNADVTYEFGYGLSYSKFKYENLHVRADSASSFTATVDVRNVGAVDTSEVVQLYASHTRPAYGKAAPQHQLVAFDKVYIPAGRTKTVRVTFPAAKLAIWDSHHDKMSVEEGTYRFNVGSSSNDIRDTKQIHVSGADFGTVDARRTSLNVFDRSFAASNVTYRESSKQNTVMGLRQDHVVNGYYVVMSRAKGAWTAINAIDFHRPSKITLTVGSKNPSSTIDVHIDSPTGPKIATLSFGNTGVSSYVISGKTSAGDIPVSEMAYKTVTTDVLRAVSGAHDLYLVFNASDVRVKSLLLG